MQKSVALLDHVSSPSVKWLSVGEVVTRFLSLMLVVSIPPICLFIDLKVIGNGVSEQSVTEIAQLVMLALTIGCFILLAQKKSTERYFFLLAAAFFACMLIRELDALFDLIAHGLWLYVAAPIALTAIINAIKNSSATLQGLLRFVSSHSGVLMLVAIAILVCYSRLMGMTGIWQNIMGDGYLRVVKNAVEEASELLGYSLILSASMHYAFQRLRTEA
ncbi:MAG: hypothetical protein AAGC78_06300 [Cellvibrio sp.]|uniref:hypothetical protein n=1 Tax=Cellvibrio sp. TaxID=1965322 RepID=UPI0031AC1B7A